MPVESTMMRGAHRQTVGDVRDAFFSPVRDDVSRVKQRSFAQAAYTASTGVSRQGVSTEVGLAQPSSADCIGITPRVGWAKRAPPGAGSVPTPPFSSLPVFPHKPRDPSEFGDVVRNERQALGKSNRRNFKVMRANPLSDALQGIANLGVVTCG